MQRMMIAMGAVVAAAVVASGAPALALAAMQRAGYEADRQRLAIIDIASKRLRIITEAWDRSVGGIAWAADSFTR